MKKVLTALAMMVGCIANGQVTNQRLFDTVGFLPDHYAKRIAYFKSQRLQKGRTVFLGNSITEGANWKELTGDTTAINRGISGDITFGVLNRLNDIIELEPSKLFLLIGINDIGKDIPDAVIADNISKIIKRLQRESPTTRIFIHSILPVNPTVRNFPQHYDKNDHIKSTNVLIRRVAVSCRVTFVDLNKVFSNRGLLSPEYTPDGLHLNASGYALWIKHLHSLGAL